MGKAANRAKTKWNSEHYSQIKFSVPPEAAALFKSACAASSVSMASVLTRFIAEYTQSACQAELEAADYVSTKRKRRRAIEEMASRMEAIRYAQECAKDNMPENLHGSAAYEAAEESVGKMDEVIELLMEIY
jgi:O-succinylbenzoate synthase